MLEILLDALLDTLKVAPFLYISYFFIEYIEHEASDKLISGLYRVGKRGPLFGAVLGVIPMCGLTVSAVDLFANKLITIGTLTALLISCSDEALPLLLSSGAGKSALALIGAKILLAAVTGILLDKLHRGDISLEQAHKEHERMHRDCAEDECEKEGVALTALIHTFKSSAFVFATLVFLGLAVEVIGEQVIEDALVRHEGLAPLLAAVTGLIPNCAPSYILAELHVEGLLSFGAMFSGLTVNAGVGLAVLWKQNRARKQDLYITLLLFVLSVLCGILLQLLLPL